MKNVIPQGVGPLPILLLCLLIPAAAPAYLPFGPEQIIQAGGVDLEVIGYSMPEVVDWNGDGLFDLVVGEGGGVDVGKVRIYLNLGAPNEPSFNGFSYVQFSGEELTYEGC